MAATGEPQPDPGGAQDAIDRYRDLAKYLITIFAAVAGLLLAGTQLASIGKLSWADTPGRVVAAAVGMAAAIGAVLWIVQRAVGVLRPVEMSLDDVAANARLSDQIAVQRSLLAGAGSIANVQFLATTSLAGSAERQVWLEVAADVTARAAYLTIERRFERALREMLAAAVVGAAGIAAFAWGANPPEDQVRPAIEQPAPVVVTVALTADGRAALRGTIGRACAKRPFRALSIGGTEALPRVVALPEGGCRQAQFMLAPAWGSATATAHAPSG